MKRFFLRFWRALIDFALYKEVITERASFAVRYLLGLVFVSTIILSVRVSFDLNRLLDQSAEWAKANVPAIAIKDGQASSSVPQPYTAKEKDFTFILDTTGATTRIDSLRGILVTKDKVIYKESQFQTREYSLSNIPHLVFDANLIEKWRKVARAIALPVLAIGVFLWNALARFAQVFFFSLFSMLINRLKRLNLSYRALFSIGAYAITPSAILGLIVGAVGAPLHYFWALYSAVYITYLMIGTSHCKAGASAAA